MLSLLPTGKFMIYANKSSPSAARNRFRFECFCALEAEVHFMYNDGDSFVHLLKCWVEHAIRSSPGEVKYATTLSEHGCWNKMKWCFELAIRNNWGWTMTFWNSREIFEEYLRISMSLKPSFSTGWNYSERWSRVNKLPIREVKVGERFPNMQTEL